MNPFFFGSGERRLFGLYMPAQAQARGAAAQAVVLCQPWGQEYLRAHRSMRRLSVLLTRAGLHVLRFDYHGTGDSAGDMDEGDLEGWCGDIETAIDELKDTCGLERVGLIGLRLGATLAAQVAARRHDDVDKVCLWDPIVSGRDYLRELHRLASPPATAASRVEVMGFVVTERLSRQLTDLQLASVGPQLPERTLAIVTAAPPAADGVRAALGKGGAVESLATQAAWVEDANTGVGAIPVNVLQRIVEWAA